MKKLYLLLILTLNSLCSTSVQEIVDNLKFSGVVSLSSVTSQLNSELQKNNLAKVNDDEALNLVLKKSGLVMLKFFAGWCGPCQKFAPIVASVAKSHKTFPSRGNTVNATYIEIDFDKYKSISRHFGVTSIPTSVIYVNGTQKQRFVGGATEQVLIARLQKLVE
ncbi:hypothetical protein A3F66_02840 [candidate division TM6 bacterium RIFCSPHIGHO2_12_FULL_32_22]|nr:MAG: hypothetical protein A3F66_02840 [candidate division TM6 bacterium RIFCSPHIGHO2_12_FULL_32_22]